jgi:hypothetical protein
LKSVPSSWQEQVTKPSEVIPIPTKENDLRADENKKSSEN